MIIKKFPTVQHYSYISKGKGKAIPLQAWTDPECSRRLRLPDFKTIRHMKVIRLSAVHTGRLYPAWNIPGTHFCLRLCQPQDLSANRRIMWMKNSNDTFGNRTRNLTTCSAVSSPTAPPRAPLLSFKRGIKKKCYIWVRKLQYLAIVHFTSTNNKLVNSVSLKNKTQ